MDFAAVLADIDLDAADMVRVIEEDRIFAARMSRIDDGIRRMVNSEERREHGLAYLRWRAEGGHLALAAEFEERRNHVLAKLRRWEDKQAIRGPLRGRGTEAAEQR